MGQIWVNLGRPIVISGDGDELFGEDLLEFFHGQLDSRGNSLRTVYRYMKNISL